MAYGVSGTKAAVQYVADTGNVYLYRHSADVIAAGGFSAGFGEPHPSKGALKPRHIGLHRPGFSAKCPIALISTFNAVALGESFSYAGQSWAVTSKVGEKTVLR